jgi:hypothetical protein
MGKIIEKQNQPNSYIWEGLTKGKLIMMAVEFGRLKNIDALANDCYYDIMNHFHKNDMEMFLYIEKYLKEKGVSL